MLRDDCVVAEITGDPSRTHGQRLPGELMRAIEAAGVGLDEIDLLAVAAGPGSFTGLRIGIASVQGLAFARGLKIVPVSTLEALARDAARSSSDRLIAPWIDAQRGEVFAALYSPDALAVVVSPTAAGPADTLEAWRHALGTRAVLFTGDGAIRYRDRIATALGAQAHVPDAAPLLAVPVARIAAEEPGRAVLPHAIVPMYVRRPDAELARERTRHQGR